MAYDKRGLHARAPELEMEDTAVGYFTGPKPKRLRPLARASLESRASATYRKHAGASTESSTICSVQNQFHALAKEAQELRSRGRRPRFRRVTVTDALLVCLQFMEFLPGCHNATSMALRA